MFSYRKFKTTDWLEPYSIVNGKKKPTLNETGTGVYLIKKKNGKIVYIGKSGKHLRRTLYRHFQTWTDLRSSYGKRLQPYERVTYKGEDQKYLIKAIFTHTEREADILEQALIIRVKPKDNSLKLMLFTQSQVNGVIEKLEDAPF